MGEEENSSGGSGDSGADSNDAAPNRRSNCDDSATRPFDGNPFCGAGESDAVEGAQTGGELGEIPSAEENDDPSTHPFTGNPFSRRRRDAADSEEQEEEQRPAVRPFDGNPFARKGGSRKLADGTSQDMGSVAAFFESEALVDIEWEVLELQISEQLNELYEIRLRLRTDQEGVEPEQLLGRECRLRLERDAQEQSFMGIAAEVLEGSSSRHHVTVELLLVPALWMLGQRRDTRIFQDKTVPEILEEVFAPLADVNREVWFLLDRDYPTAEYRLQYDETDLDFAQRLMEEEGIVYWFDHGGEWEILVLVDASARHNAIDRPDGASLQMTDYSSGGDNRELVREYHRRNIVRSTALETRHWDWTRAAVIEGDDEGEGEARPEYDHDNRPLTLHEYDTGALSYQANDADEQVRLRRELQLRDARVGEGESNVLALRPGRTFELTGHRQGDLGGELLLTRVVHRFNGEGASGESEDRYRNTFDCIPTEVPFRPDRRTPRPRVHGVQTATVVGPVGEEIHTDEHGRVLVQFHWDRVGGMDEHSSCWIRVVQPWSGPGWGFLFLPRIGMEVVVTFVNGDPDQPMVTGAVYNGHNSPPYPLPDEKTKSSIKTRSTPESEGYNELTFEDAAGEEQIIVHAQKDYNETVENNHATTVHAGQTNTVDGDQSESVGGDQSLSVEGSRTKTVVGDEEIIVKTTRTQTIHGLEKVSLLDARETEVGTTELHRVCGALTEEFQGGRHTTVGQVDEEQVNGNKTLEVSQQYLVGSDQQMKLVQGDANFLRLDGLAKLGTEGVVTVTNGRTQVEGGTDGKLTLSADSEISLVCGGSSITLKADGTIELTGATVTTTGAGGSVEASGSGVAATGGQVNLSAGVVDISGAVVKVN